MKLAPRVIRAKPAEWAPWAELALRATQAPLVSKAQMDSKGSWARKVHEAPRDPKEISAIRAPPGPEAQQVLAETAEISATQEERGPMVLPAVVVPRVQEAIPAQSVLLVPLALQDPEVKPVPQATRVQRAPRALPATRAL